MTNVIVNAVSKYVPELSNKMIQIIIIYMK